MSMPVAQAVLRDFSDVRLAFGMSDEYSFALHKDTTLYGAPARQAATLANRASACVWPARLCVGLARARHAAG